MENNNEYDFLPVGTIITVKFSDSRYMITGYFVENNGIVYDYCALECPKGFNDFSDLTIFDKDQINSVVNKGYSNDEYEAYVTTLKKENGLLETEQSGK